MLKGCSHKIVRLVSLTIAKIGAGGRWMDRESFHFDIFDLNLIKTFLTLCDNGDITDKHCNYVFWHIFETTFFEVLLQLGTLTCKSLSSMSYCQSREFRANLQQMITYGQQSVN